MTLGVLAGIPCASGLAGMLAGPSVLPGDDSQVSATLESEYRFTNAFWFAIAPVIWSQLPKVEEDPVALRATMGVVFLGGLVRLMAWRRSGRPHPVFVAATALELVGMPITFAWQRHVAALAE